MEFLRRQPVVAAVLALVLGVFVGLVIGWGIWPVQWQGGGPQHLAEADQVLYLRSLGDLYERDGNASRIQQSLVGWDNAVATICSIGTRFPEDSQRMNAMAAVLNEGRGCTDFVAAPSGDTGGGLGRLLLLLVVLLAAAGVLLYLFTSRRPDDSTQDRPVIAGYEDTMLAAMPETEYAGAEPAQVTPVARFRTTYNRGHDTYDDSFSIESADGDFLGECGAGISESIGADTPKRVTALEVWLFDKNDIRTVTKVLMSDHAFFDEGFKAKLAPKGEPVLARLNETIVLETASLIVNAEVTELEYGEGDGPESSFFERITIELSAWAKDGDFNEPDIQGRIDEIMDY